jgi:regulator of sigma E protease
MREGDELVGYKKAEEFVQFAKNNHGKEVTLKLLRNGEELVKTVTLRANPKEGEGALGAAVSDYGFERAPLGRAFVKGFTDAVGMVAEIFKAFVTLIAQLVTGAHVPDNIVGPVGIFSMAGEFSKLGFTYVLQIIAMISLNLAALNALPIPALDGGRILFLIIEKSIGRPIHPKKELWANGISFGLLILLMIIITGRDIVRLF